MNNLNFASGIKDYQVNGKETLRFNPSDIAVYNRFVEVTAKIEQLERDMESQVHIAEDGKKALGYLCELDKKVKALLAYVFGEENDFEAIFEGVNVMAMADGERVITNFFNAIRPIIEEGAKSHTKDKMNAAVEQAKKARNARMAGV